MNGELDQLSRLVLYVKDIMRSGRVVDFKLEEYEKLSFIPKKNSLFSKVEECSDAQSWYKLLEKREIKDIHLVSYFEEDNMPQTKLHRDLEGGMAVSIGRLRPDTQYDIKFVCLSHNTLRGAAGGAVLLAELLCAAGYMDR